MKMALLILAALIVAAVGGLVFLAQQSKSGSAPGLTQGGLLAPCPSSPNCVASEEGAPESHAVAPLPLLSWERLPSLIAGQGGQVVVQTDDYLAATFTTPLLGFVDDVEFRKAEDAVHVRSASRVGHSDMGANRKRIEALRLALEN